jgi:type III protein arginine methyltransferase
MTDDVAIAKRAFEPLVAAASGNPRALLAMAAKALHREDDVRCYQLVQEALSLAEGDSELMAMGADLLARSVPSWHVRMMNDGPRNQAFQDAIERAVAPGAKVLDIGTGSGLLSMMAARAGAQSVHTCEMHPVLAEVATGIIASNGFADRVTVHAINSRKLDPEADLGGPADVVVAEIVGDDLICEEVLPSMRDAVRRLARPGAKFIPRGGEIRVALAHYANADKADFSTLCGFDVSAFNRLQPSRLSVKVGDPALVVRGEAISLFDFAFDTADVQGERAEAELVANGGPVNGVIQWFRLTMDDVAQFENGPDQCDSSSWGWKFFRFAEALDLQPGQRVAVSASVAGNRLRVWQA